MLVLTDQPRVLVCPIRRRVGVDECLVGWNADQALAWALRTVPKGMGKTLRGSSWLAFSVDATSRQVPDDVDKVPNAPQEPGGTQTRDDNDRREVTKNLRAAFSCLLRMRSEPGLHPMEQTITLHK